jgi:copper(I)-binding protein
MLPTLPRTTTAALLVALVLAACTAGAAAPTIEDPWVRSNPNGLGAAYMRITMPADDRLIAVEVDASIAARVEVHEVIDDAGRMQMREVEGGIPLPSGIEVSLRPGAYHIMLLDMPMMLKVGSTVTLTLRFAEADAVTVEAEVREGADTHGSEMHGTHQDGTHKEGMHHGGSSG